MTAPPRSYEGDLARIVAEWDRVAVRPAQIAHWANEVQRLRAEQTRLRAAGQWRSGGRTLLHALGAHHDEVLMCRGLAWLLTPDGWHGLGSAVLDGVLGHLGLPAAGSGQAVVVVEEARGDTRADIVIRFEGTTVLIEAKVFAGEQEEQADRLASGWGEEVPHLVFLTRTGHLPSTAVDSAGRWAALTWATIGRVLAAALAARPDCEPGAQEYLRTVRVYGGSGA